MSPPDDETLLLPQATTFSVEGDERYVVDVLSVADEASNEKGALAQVEFHDARRRPLEMEMEGWRTSDKYGLNRYVSVMEASSGGRPTRLEIATPKKARTMTVLISPWAATAEPRLAERPSANLDRRLFLSAEALIIREYSVVGDKTFTLSGRSIGYSGEPERAGLVEIEFLDRDGAAIDGESHYFESDAPFLVWLEPPTGSQTIRAGFLRAEAKRPLALIGEPQVEEAVLQKAGATERLPLPQSLQKRVSEGHKYLIEGVCASEGPANPRGAVLRIEFRGPGGALIESRLEGWEHSGELGAHRYLPTEGATAEGKGFSIAVTAPPKAQTATIQFLPWAATARPYLVGTIAVNLDPTIELSREKPVTFSFPVEASGAHFLVGRLTGSSPAGDRVALISVEYFDEAGQLLPGPYPGFGRSPRAELGYYQYIGGLAKEERTSFVQWIEPVERSARIELSLRKWTAGDDLALEQAPDYGKARAETLEELLEPQPDHERLLTMLARLHSVEGCLTAHVEAMGRRAATVWTPAARRAYRQAAGKLEELDTEWLPSLAGQRETPSSKEGERICHLFKVSYPFENTGGAIRNLNTVSSQLAVGLDPYVVTPLNYPATHGIEEFEREELVAGVPHIRLPIRGDAEVLPDTKRLRYDTQLTATVIEERGADVIHAASGYRGYELGLKGLALRDHFDKPLVYEVRSFHEHLWGSGRGEGILEREWTRMRRAQELRCMTEADAVVTIAEAMRGELVERGVAEEKIHVVPNAVDENRFRSVPSSDELRVRLGLVGATVVGYVSNISYREGHDTLIRAFAELSRDRADLWCLLVGDGPERERVEALAGALGVRDRLVTTGEVDNSEIDHYYALIDVFVVPRRSDYASDYVTPLKPYEALALERPIVVSDRPSLREIVGEEDRGLVFRSEDHEHLAARVGELLDSPDRRRMLGRVGREWVLSERIWRKNAERYREIYAEVRERSAAGAAPLLG